MKLQTIPVSQIDLSNRDDIYLRMYFLVTQDLETYYGWHKGMIEELGTDPRKLKGHDYFLNLCEDIQNNGIKEPIVVQQVEDRYYVEDGAHRVAIARVLGINHISSHVGTFDDWNGHPSTYLFSDRNGIRIPYDKESPKISNVFKYISDDIKNSITLISMQYELNMGLWKYLNRGTFVIKNKVRKFGRGKLFYQSLEGIVEGNRNTTQRLNEYNLTAILNKDHEVLDIGAACGFIALTLCDHVKSVHCIEGSPELMQIGITANNYLMKENCKFEVINFHDFKASKKYDAVLALAVHAWLDWEITFETYANRLIDLTKQQGYIIFESHGISDDNPETAVDEKIEKFKHACNVIRTGYLVDSQPDNRGTEIRRKYAILQKK